MSASLALSIAALVISAGSVVFAWRSAVAARRSAVAAEGSLAIERERWVGDRRPRLTGVIEGDGEHRVLRITLDSDEPLVGLDVVASEWRFYGEPIGQGGWDFEFNPRVYGVVVPSPGEPAVRAYCYNPDGGEPAGLEPYHSITWAVNTKDRLECVRLEVTCHGARGERWDLVLRADAQPRIEDTIG